MMGLVNPVHNGRLDGYSMRKGFKKNRNLNMYTMTAEVIISAIVETVNHA